MSTFIEARVIQKVDTEANWMANPLKLYQGEVAFVSDKYNFKLNTTEIPKTFAELEYYYKGDILGGVLPTDDLASKPNGVYRATISGTYSGVVVKEGYYTLLRKKDDGSWVLESEVKVDSGQVDQEFDINSENAISNKAVTPLAVSLKGFSEAEIISDYNGNVGDKKIYNNDLSVAAENNENNTSLFKIVIPNNAQSIKLKFLVPWTLAQYQNLYSCITFEKNDGTLIKYKGWNLVGNFEIFDKTIDLVDKNYKNITITWAYYSAEYPNPPKLTFEFLDNNSSNVKDYIDLKTQGSLADKEAIDLIDFGCKGDGVTDDTIKFQEAINTIVANGGGKLYGRNNTFKVSTLSIPDVKLWQKIEISGAEMPVPRFGTVGTFDNMIKNSGMRIISNLNDIGRGVVNVNSGSSHSGFNMVLLSLKNLTISTYDNPNCHGVNARNAVQLNMENVQIDTSIYNVQASNPTNISGGLLTPKISNGAFTYLRNVSVSGYNIGIQIEEHTDADQIIISSCKYGLDFMVADHASYFKRVCSQRNQNHVRVSGKHIFEIAQLNMEYAGVGQTDTNNAWQATQYELLDENNLGVGEIKYANVKGVLGIVDSFVINGGANVIVKKVGSETRLTGNGIPRI